MHRPSRIREQAEEEGCTPAQLALAWLVRRSDDVIPIPGTTSMKRLEENHPSGRGAAAGERYDPDGLELTNR